MGANEKKQAVTEYTPSTKAVRAIFSHHRDAGMEACNANLFDRWLAGVRAQAKAEALEEAASAYPVMLRDMISRPSVAAWLRDRAEQYSTEADE